MAEQKNGPVETGAAMDYSEHERTYVGFLAAAKYGTITIVALFIAMALFFFSGAGAIVSFLAFLILSIGGSILAR
ncbi:Bacterial aa3 type cytochrome c oxidase subunit IV [Hoeflea sp. IMCC20628]|uniref:aa3-type cytochrome c oxidase subunit IV n=1 Tax=Hoeflea sp. IMCC20628 TaxID=1620421 RepID=UPI00063A86E5|nr:aa3-type cytochrome c oxidase subunit IV [Hoeflea sp. IMCC20628]AKH99057.1 Bacterial aa3 type cytochrome c oxidase subunit IV [Hoeflea sp. IMCC20628]